MRYIISRLGKQDLEEVQQGEGCIPTLMAPVICASRGEAEAALMKWIADPDFEDWLVCEIVDGKVRQRSVIFKDGHPEIQS